MKPYGPTQRTMNRMFEAKASKDQELVTDWIPCTTPPVRDGVYEARQIGYHSDCFMVEYRSGKWFHTKLTPGVPLSAMEMAYQWRGVRRWVLQGSGESHMPVHARLCLVRARPRDAYWGTLINARPFKTKAAAERFAARYSRLGLTAVLP